MTLDETRDSICQAIDERRVISFVYKDKPRVIEPYLCGAGATGKYILLGFQTGGHSSTNKFGWKLFDLINIRNLEISEAEFNISGAERSRYSPKDPRFRKTFAAIPKG